MAESKRRLVVATANVGTKGRRKADPGAVLELARSCHALALQQLSGPDGDAMVRLLRHDPDLRVIRRSRRLGQAAVGLVFRPDDLRLIVPVHRLLMAGQRVNPDTGPELIKPKWLVGATVEHRRASVVATIASTHRVAGQTPERDTERDEHAHRHAQRVATEMRNTDGYSIVGADWNSLPGDDSLRPLRQAGWTCDQLRGRRLDTHGHWCPDHVWWEHQERLHFVGHRLGRPIGGDHRPLVATFQL